MGSSDITSTLADVGKHRSAKLYPPYPDRVKVAVSVTGALLSTAAGQRPAVYGPPNHGARYLTGGVQQDEQESVWVVVPPLVPDAPPAGPLLYDSCTPIWLPAVAPALAVPLGWETVAVVGENGSDVAVTDVAIR